MFEGQIKSRQFYLVLPPNDSWKPHIGSHTTLYIISYISIGDGYGADHASDHESFTILTYGNGHGFEKNSVSADGEIVRPATPEESRYKELWMSIQNEKFKCRFFVVHL